MSPAKQKCDELIEKFIPAITVTYPKLEWKYKLAKQCALICVESHIAEHTFKHPLLWNIRRAEFWNEVKREIEKL